MTHPQFYKANYFFPLSASSGIGQFSDGVRISFITLSKPITIPDTSWRDHVSLLGLHADYKVPEACLA